MKVFGITIISLACISILIDVLLPEGKICKYIKGIYSILSILIIFSSIIAIFNSGINLDGIFNSNDNEFAVDNQALTSIALRNSEQNAEIAVKLLNDNNIKTHSINITYKNENCEIEKVKVNLEKLVIENENEHINTISKVKELVAIFIKVDTKRIEIYEI